MTHVTQDFIKTNLRNEVPFAVHQTPNADDVLFYEGITNKIDGDSDVFVAYPFNNGTPLYFLSVGTQKLTSNELVAQHSEMHFTSEAEHIARAEQAIAMLRSGKLDKVILSRIHEFNTEHSPGVIYDALAEAYPDCHVYAFYHPSAGLWIGASPEDLVSRRGDVYSTMALAGTRKAIGTRKDWGPKESEEQAFVETYIEEKLLSLEVNNLRTIGPSTLRFGSIEHICTKFEFRSMGNDLDIALALHPTPAVCGLPVEEAKAHIETLEQHDRGFYAGFAGSISKEKTDLFVTLRCLCISNGQQGVFVGGGITSESAAESEYQETVLKAQTILGVIEKI